MKKLSAIIFTILFVCTTTVAQTNFYQLYDYQNKSDFGRQIVESNSDLVVFGHTTGSGASSKFLKADTAGNTLFHKGYVINNDWVMGGGDWFQGYYGFGWHSNPVEGAADSHFMYINDSGDSVKVVSINFEFNDRIHDAILMEDSTFVVLGFYTDTAATDTKPFVANVDSLGNVLWFKTHNNPGNKHETLKNIAVTPDGGYIVGGREPNGPGGFQDMFLIKLDSVGNFEWKQNYGIPNYSEFEGHVTVCKNGGYAIAGSIVKILSPPPFPTVDGQRGLIRVDSVGNVLWQKDFGTTTFGEKFKTARELPNGDFICLGNSFHMHNNQQINDINLTRLDSAGNLIWSRDYAYNASHVMDIPNDLIVTSDGGFAVTGFITNVACCRRNDVFILKVDGQGLITSLNSGFKEVPAAWKVYPNPTQGQVTIPQHNGLVGIQLFNQQGQLIQEIQANRSSETIINIEGSPGIYLLCFQMEDGSVSSTKVVKQ